MLFEGYYVFCKMKKILDWVCSKFRQNAWVLLDDARKLHGRVATELVSTFLLLEATRTSFSLTASATIAFAGFFQILNDVYTALIFQASQDTS